MIVGITGWRGFIGSHLKERIENPVLFQGDMRKLDDVALFVRECDLIYHVAGLNRASDGAILANNIVSTGNLVLACKLQRVFPEIVFLSSTQIEWSPNSEYSVAKRIEEKIIEINGKWCIFKVPNVYGPGAKPFYNSVVATFAFQIAHGKEVVMDNQNATREFIYIDDLINGLLKPECNEFVRPMGEIMSIKDVYDYLTIRLGEHENLKKCLDYYKKDGDVVSAS